MAILAFSIIISLKIPDFNDHLAMNFLNHHFFTILFFSLYAILLLMNMIILKLNIFEKQYKKLKPLIPICNIILNLLIFIFIFDQYEDQSCSLFFLYELLFTVFFDSEYQESVLFYSEKCIFSLLLFMIK